MRLRVRILDDEGSDSLATTGVRVTGPQYDPGEMDIRTPDPDRIDPPTAWLAKTRPSDGCPRGSFHRAPATRAHQKLPVP